MTRHKDRDTLTPNATNRDRGSRRARGVCVRRRQFLKDWDLGLHQVSSHDCVALFGCLWLHRLRGMVRRRCIRLSEVVQLLIVESIHFYLCHGWRIGRRHGKKERPLTMGIFTGPILLLSSFGKRLSSARIAEGFFAIECSISSLAMTGGQCCCCLHGEDSRKARHEGALLPALALRRHLELIAPLSASFFGPRYWISLNSFRPDSLSELCPVSISSGSKPHLAATTSRWGDIFNFEILQIPLTLLQKVSTKIAMKLQIAKVIGFAGLLMSRAVAVTPPYANFTTASFNNITIATSTASSLHTIYTTAPNSSVANVSITLYNLNAYVDEKTLQAQ